MKQRFYLFRRCGTYYLQDARTNKQRSLETKDRSTAVRLLEIKRQTDTHDRFNQILLKTCLTASDSMLTRRTWADVMEQMKTHGRESTRLRCERAMNCSAIKSLQHIKLVDSLKLTFSWDPQRRRFEASGKMRIGLLDFHLPRKIPSLLAE